MPDPIRLDLILMQRFELSRNHSQEIIIGGKVKVDGKIIDKPSKRVSAESNIEILAEPMKYVGRGGHKLDFALEYFAVDVSAMVCMDIGASTGGFTDCLLQNGAEKIYAVENGCGQLHEKILHNSKVVSMENTNILDLDKSLVPEDINFICTDVSFISIKKILHKIYDLLGKNGVGIMLIKPQFETEKTLNIKDKKTHYLILKNLYGAFMDNNLNINGIISSPITGKSGNKEYLLYINNARPPIDQKKYDILSKEAVDKAFIIGDI